MEHWGQVLTTSVSCPCLSLYTCFQTEASQVWVCFHEAFSSPEIESGTVSMENISLFKHGVDDWKQWLIQQSKQSLLSMSHTAYKKVMKTFSVQFLLAREESMGWVVVLVLTVLGKLNWEATGKNSGKCILNRNAMALSSERPQMPLALAPLTGGQRSAEELLHVSSSSPTRSYPWLGEKTRDFLEWAGR